MTGEPREQELKYKLDSEADYQAVLDACDPINGRPRSVFSNNYFDTPDLHLARNKAMLRIRSGNGLVLCFKKGGEKEGCPGFFDVVEVEGRAEHRLLESALDDPDSLLNYSHPAMNSARKHFSLDKLKYLGSLETVRRYRRYEGFLLECDEVNYPDGSRVYEIEVETVDPELARNKLIKLFGEAGVAAHPQSRSKLQGLLRWAGLLAE